MKQKNTILVILNSVSLLVMLCANYASNVAVFSKFTVADISHKYNTLFAPAGYAFIIWGFLFLLAIAFVVYQWFQLEKGDPGQYIKRTGIWFTVGNIANCSWLYFWTNEMMGWSVILILLLLLSLITLTVRLRLELDDKPVSIIFFVWWPITFYLGWIMVATIACISAWLVSLQSATYSLSESTWTISLILIACVLYLVLIFKRNMREAALVGAWAFIAIAFRQWNKHDSITICAFIAALILLMASAFHGYKNRNYNIITKWKRHEW